MKNYFFRKLPLIFLLLVSAEFLLAQIPPGGTMLNATTGTTYRRPWRATLTEVTVTGQPFTKALRFVCGTNVTNFWDDQIQFPAVDGISKDDVVLVAFYARTITSQYEEGVGFFNVVIEQNSSPYEKDVSMKMTVGKDWKQYFVRVKCKQTLSATQVSYAFHIGYQSQTVEIADIKFINYKNTLKFDDLPETEITYFGRAADAEWRAPAQERINQIRKGIAEITVFDENGNILPGAEVSVEMVRHKFGFGTAIPASVFLSNKTFRNKVYELFNEVVFENDLKWPSLSTTTKNNVRMALDSLDRKKIVVRGHNVIWPSWQFLPSSLKTYESNPVALRNEIDRHIDEVTQFTKGRLIDWDVINEPYSEKDIMAILGNEVMADWFKRVRNNDRTVKLYLNDYSIVSDGGNNKVKQDYYFNLVKYIDEMGGNVEGIGFQGHFGSDLTSPAKVYSIIDRFATLGKEIKITEHDINVTQRQVQADYTRDFMTICFSHEAVKSFLFWGFWANSHWLPDGALFNSDWSIRPNGEAYKDLVFNRWWTKKTDTITNASGKTSFEGFLGTYKYTIKTGDKVRTGTFYLNNSKKSGIANPVVLSFDSNVPDNVEIKASKPACLCVGENITLQTVSGEGLTYQWFRDEVELTAQSSSVTVTEAGFYSVKVKKGAVEIISPPFEVKVNPVPEAKISASGNLSFCPGGNVNLKADVSKEVSYNWMRGVTKINGSVPTIEAKQSGSYTLVASANGCTAKSEAVNVQVFSANDPSCTTGMDENEILWQVYPNPFKGTFTVNTVYQAGESIRAELFNATGVLVKNIELGPNQGKTIVTVSTPGFYTLRVSSGNQVGIFKLIGY